MIKEHKLIRLNNGRLVHVRAMEEIKRQIREYIQNNGKITLLECKDLLGIGRTITLTILEYLDNIRFTSRIGDHRVLILGKK